MKERTDETVHRFSCVCENHKWLSLVDSNHLNKNQNLAYYHYTKGQDNGSSSRSRTDLQSLKMICTNRYTMEPIKNLADVGIAPNVFFRTSAYETDDFDF